MYNMTWIGLRCAPMMILLGRIAFMNLNVFRYVIPLVCKFLEVFVNASCLTFDLIEN